MDEKSIGLGKWDSASKVIGEAAKPAVVIGPQEKMDTHVTLVGLCRADGFTPQAPTIIVQGKNLPEVCMRAIVAPNPCKVCYSPLLVMACVHQELTHGLPGTRVYRSDSGGMTDEIFGKIAIDLANMAKCHAQKPVLIMVDGHGTRESYANLLAAREV